MAVVATFVKFSVFGSSPRRCARSRSSSSFTARCPSASGTVRCRLTRAIPRLSLSTIIELTAAPLGIDPVAPEIADRLLLNGRQRDSVHAPDARQARRQLGPRVQRPFIVAADHDKAVAAAERRGDRRDQPLARMERGDVDRLAVDQALDELIRPAHENRHDDGSGLRDFPVAKNQRQRQRRCFVTDTGRKVGGDFDIGHRRRRRDNDAGGDRISEAVAVGVAGQAEGRHERRQRLRAPGLGVERRKGGDGDEAERGGEGQQGESALHLTAILRRSKSVARKTKGHRVIAVPPCSTDLAPPAFTAPCRNQTSDLSLLRASGMPI